MQPVLNVPMLADDLHQALRRTRLSTQAGNAKNHFIGEFAGFLGLNDALQAKDWSDMRPGELAVEL